MVRSRRELAPKAMPTDLAVVREEALEGVRITAVVPDPRRPGTVLLKAEGRTLFTVPADAARSAGVVAGQGLTTDQIGVLEEAADVEAAFRTALRRLERRGFAARDLVRRLVQKGHPPAAAEAAVDKARELGLVDDEAWARQFVEVRFARGRGAGRLRLDLLAQGVAAPTIDRVLAQAVSPELARGQLEALARKRLGQLADLPREVRQRRTLAYLARRGYRGREASEVVAALLRSS